VSTHVYLPKSQPPGIGWCGPTSLANALAIYGIPTTPEECAGACQAPGPDQGVTDDDLARGLKKFGFRANKKTATKKSEFQRIFKWVRKQTDTGKLVLCTINGNYATCHIVLIMRVVRGGVQVWDPHDNESKVISRRNLFQAWWNITDPKDREMETLTGVALIAMSPRSKLARRAVEVRTNLLNPPKGKLPTEKAPYIEEKHENP